MTAHINIRVENKFATPPSVLCSVLLFHKRIIKQRLEGHNIFITCLCLERSERNDKKYESIVLAEGLAHCGGIDIDREIYNDMRSKIPSGFLQPLKDNKRNRWRFERQLAELAVKVKHYLSSAENAYEDIAVGFETLEYNLERGGLEKMAADLVSQSTDCCRNILENAGLTLDEINGILLVGGTSRMPLVQDMVGKFARNVPVYMDADPALSVVQGALQLAGHGNSRHPQSGHEDGNGEQVAGIIWCYTQKR